MNKKKLSVFISIVCLMVTALGLVPSASAQDRDILHVIEVVAGAPDLTTYISAKPTGIYGGPNFSGINESSSITVTVANQLTASPFPQAFDGRLQVFGSEARGVFVSFDLPIPLSQVGNMSIPAGFQCAVTPTNHLVFCWGGNIPAGGSVDFGIDVIGSYTCGSTAIVRAVADPYNWLPEANETNNDASVAISVYSIC